MKLLKVNCVFAQDIDSSRLFCFKDNNDKGFPFFFYYLSKKSNCFCGGWEGPTGGSGQGAKKYRIDGSSHPHWSYQMGLLNFLERPNCNLFQGERWHTGLLNKMKRLLYDGGDRVDRHSIIDISIEDKIVTTIQNIIMFEDIGSRKINPLPGKRNKRLFQL